LTADAKTKIYGSADPELTFTAEADNGAGRGLVLGDTFTGALSRAAGANVGSYSITAAAKTNSNYLITASNGALTISQRPITLTADTKTKVFGNTDPALTYTIAANGTNQGRVGSDTFTGALARTGGEGLGSYTIDASALANGNYLITAVDGTLRIIKASLPAPPLSATSPFSYRLEEMTEMVDRKKPAMLSKRELDVLLQIIDDGLLLPAAAN